MKIFKMSKLTSLFFALLSFFLIEYLFCFYFRAGLQSGDVIVAVNNQAIKDTDDLYEATVDNTVLFATVVRGDMKIGLKIEFD